MATYGADRQTFWFPASFFQILIECKIVESCPDNLEETEYMLAGNHCIALRGKSHQSAMNSTVGLASNSILLIRNFIYFSY